MYKDLFKISINFIAIKLFLDCISILPEKIYQSFIQGSWMTNVILYLLLNFLIVFLLLRLNKFLVGKIFPKKENYLNNDCNSLSIVEISIIICAYYSIFTTGFSLISNIFFTEGNNFSMIIGKLSSIIVSFLLLRFSDIIAKKIKIAYQ
ncbi:hypothetical protein CEQ15_15005 [Chryseobacterium indologenes]|uniref:hypothetical protein n=1 Tax=Chryseobacterium indologenes TaxID=253 RepID=UPI000B519AD9|nr:hypothetical protein [Chryseobacterium indologenes]ASE62715.1 hypothetical protein CEQ15_15005 [Chryseobacterium indologenes]